MAGGSHPDGPRRRDTTQYACGDYIARLEAAGIQTSMSRAGCPYDNAMAESFMKTLKHEEVDAAPTMILLMPGTPSGSSSRPPTTADGLIRLLPTCHQWNSNQPRAAAQQPAATTQPSCPSSRLRGSIHYHGKADTLIAGREGGQILPTNAEIG